MSKIITTKFFHDLTSHTIQKFFHSQNFMLINLFHIHKNFPDPQIYPYSYPQNFAMIHQIKFTHTNKISHMHHKYIHTSLQHKFFTMSMPTKSKPKFIQQHHKLPTLPKFHKPPTLSKLHCDKKYNTSKMFQSQDYNEINHTMPQITTRSHNKMTMSHH